MAGDWGSTYIVYDMWWCEDEVCDCTKPEITLIEPNRQVGKPWIKRTSLWEGTFHTEASAAEHDEQQAELEMAWLLTILTNGNWGGTGQGETT